MWENGTPSRAGRIPRMSQVSTPQVPMPAPPPAPEPEAPTRRRGMIALAVGVVLVVVAGVVAFAITRSDTAEAQPLALSFTQGQERTYDVHQTMDANISSPLFGDEPLSMDVTAGDRLEGGLRRRRRDGHDRGHGLGHERDGERDRGAFDAGSPDRDPDRGRRPGPVRGRTLARRRRPDPGVRVPRDGTAHPDPARRRRRGVGGRHLGQGVLAGLPVRRGDDRVSRRRAPTCATRP